MNSLADFFTKLVNRWLPDPLVIAIFLTFITLFMAMIFGKTAPLQAIMYWGDGFWNLLPFTMQMTIILLTGYMLAKTPIAGKALDYFVSKIESPKTAIIVITLVGAIGSWLNWGFGLVAGSIIARKFAIKIKNLHYPLAIAAGFSGFSIYGVGLSGSVPLLIASNDHFLIDKMGSIPISETIFSPFVLMMSISVVVFLPLFNAFMHPKNPKDIICFNQGLDASVGQINTQAKSDTLGTRLNDSPWVGIGIGLIGIIYAIMYFGKGGNINLNIVNFLFLMLGLMLFAKPSSYLATLNDAIKIVSGIVIQYPFYAGIMAILVGSELIVNFSDLFVSISSSSTLPLWSFISAGLINIFVPSGGGQWAVQGPVMIEAANQLNASHAATAIAVQIGDQWTNIVQPFWILPALAISGLKLKDVMGYMVLIFTFLGIVFGMGVLVWGVMS